MGLWENAEENQPLIGCLISSLTHSLLIEIRAVLIIQEAKYKLVHLTRLFIASLALRLHSTEQCIQKHNTNHAIEKYTNRKITQCKLHAGLRPYVHNKYFNWLALNMIQRFNTRARVLKRIRDVIFSNNIIFYSLQGLHRQELNIARLPSVLDPIVMDALNSVYSFGLFPRAPRFFPQKIAGSCHEIALIRASNFSSVSPVSFFDTN